MPRPSRDPTRSFQLNTCQVSRCMIFDGRCSGTGPELVSEGQVSRRTPGDFATQEPGDLSKIGREGEP